MKKNNPKFYVVWKGRETGVFNTWTDCKAVIDKFDGALYKSYESKEEAFEKLLGRIHPGAIVLLHSTSSTNASILDELLTKWEEMGYTFGTLEELVTSESA